MAMRVQMAHVARAVWLVSALPGGVLLWRWQTGQLGVVPAEALLHQSGRLALLFLMAVLVLGFVQSLLDWRPLRGARRPLGVWTFLYAAGHASAWLMLDQGGNIGFALAEAQRMAHVQIGLAALVLLAPLAITSVDAAPRLLGYGLWKRLHLLVWPVTVLVIAHTWVVSRFQNPVVLVLTAVVAVLIVTRIRAARRRPPTPAG